MSAVVEAVAYVVVETTAYVTGRIVGRSFRMERNRALQIGQYVVYGAIVLGGWVLCLVYT
jgi:hypothetical protein